MNRVELDIQGTVYTFPVNPAEYDGQFNYSYSLQSTIDSSVSRFEPVYDNRKRVMRWRGIPNRSPYNTMIPTFLSSIGISGVRLNVRDMDIAGDQNQYRDIYVQDVVYNYVPGQGVKGATNSLRFDIDLIFTFTSAQDSLIQG